jgi:phage gp29-like protein
MAKQLSQIVDLWGRPIESETLDEPQTKADAKLAPLYREFADHPSSGLTPSKLATILREAEQGNLKAQCELAEDMEEKDAHIQSEIGKRRMALQGVEWNIKPPRNATPQEQKDAEMIQELLEDATWLDDAIFDLSDATLKSFSNLELDWAFQDGLHLIEGVAHRDPSWFQTHPDDRNQLRLRNGSYEGAELQPFGWIRHTAKAKSGYLSRRGLVRVLAWPFLFKNYSVRDLAEFLEIYGLPIRIGKYPEGATEGEKATLMRAVMSIGHNAGGIIPKGMDIEFQNAADGGSDPFLAMMSWCEKSQSKAILGGTLTSQADGKTSTNALGNVHNEVRQEIRDFDLQRLAATLTRDVVYPLYALNGKSYQSPHRTPRFEFETAEPEDIKMLSDSLPGLVSLGARIPLQWLHDKTQIPMAKDGDVILGQQMKAFDLNNADNPAKEQQPVALAALKAKSERDIVDDQLANLHNRSGSLLEAMVEPVREMVQNATSLTALRDDILNLQGVIGLDDLAEVMAQAMAAAELAGIVDVEDGK